MSAVKTNGDVVLRLWSGIHAVFVL